MLKKIISGGQTGVDRAALDAAIQLNIPHGGWCPKGRMAELDETIPLKYSLTETESSEYSERTKLNIRDSDGTIIFVPAIPLTVTDGTLLTIQEVSDKNKPYLIIDLSKKIDIPSIIEFVKKNHIEILNIAGPRESQCPGIYTQCIQLFNQLFSVLQKSSMPLINTHNIKLYFEIIESLTPTDETCLLIGGLTRDHTVWRKLVPPLSTFSRVLIFDNRDSGQSTAAPTQYEIADFADDVANLIKSLNLPPVHIIGHSMGGFAGIHFAAKYPELIKTLTLCSTAGKQTSEGITYLTERVSFIENSPIKKATTASRENILAVMDKLYAPETLKNKDFVEEIIKHETCNPYPQSADSFKRQAIACIHHDAMHLLKDISCPTLILTGEHDHYYTPENARELASRIKHSKVVIVPNAAHMVQLENPGFLFSALKKFVVQGEIYVKTHQ